MLPGKNTPIWHLFNSKIQDAAILCGDNLNMDTSDKARGRNLKVGMHS